MDNTIAPSKKVPRLSCPSGSIDHFRSARSITDQLNRYNSSGRFYSEYTEKGHLRDKPTNHQKSHPNRMIQRSWLSAEKKFNKAFTVIKG